MKNNSLKICCTFILLLAIGSLKAQSLQQRHQQDMDQRKKQVNEVLLKAKQQQVQQKAESTTPVNTPQTNPVQPRIQTTPAPQQQNDIKPAVTPSSGKQKQLATEQKSPARKATISQ